MRALAATLVFIALTAAQEPSPAIDGRWVNPSGSVIIDIAACGEARCGTVKWASAKAINDARKGTDQLVGSNLLTELKEKKAGQWHGRLFVPDLNFRAHASLALEDPATLKVRGCSVGGLLCRAQRWTRAD